MRVLYLVPAYPPFVGGAQRLAYAIVEFMRGKGHEVRVLTTDARSASDFWVPGLRVWEAEEDIRRWPIRYWPGSWWLVGLLRQVTIWVSKKGGIGAKVAKRLGWFFPWLPGFVDQAFEWAEWCDVIHVLDSAYDAVWMAAGMVAYRTKKPLVAHPLLHLGTGQDEVFVRHTMPHQIEVLRQSARVVALTEGEAYALERLGVSADRVRVLGVPVRVEEYGRGCGEEFRRKWGVRGELVGFLGTVSEDKGVSTLIDAVGRLWKRGKRVELVVAGPSVGLRLPQCGYLHRVGVLSEKEKHDLLAAIDVLALPSRVESFGWVYLEAWLYGKPVVGARAGGVPWVVEDGEDGILVEYGDVEGLADALAWLLNDRERARVMGERGRQKVLARFADRVILAEMEKLYEDCLGSAQISSF